MTSPLLVLSTPQSHAGALVAMLGQHPELYGLPDLHLCAGPLIESLLLARVSGRLGRLHGLARAIAQVYTDTQDDKTINLAYRWLFQNRELRTSEVMTRLTQRMEPCRPIDKSVSTVFNPQNLKRADEYFPDASYLHLTRHPRSFGSAIVTSLGGVNKIPPFLLDTGCDPPVLDPQILWCSIHTNALRFLDEIPEERVLRVQIEQVLTSPKSEFSRILAWLGLESSDEHLQAMQHPENSPFAGLGPEQAKYGDELSFLESPGMPDADAETELAGALPWRDDVDGFSSEVVELAEQLGYA